MQAHLPQRRLVRTLAYSALVALGCSVELGCSLEVDDGAGGGSGANSSSGGGSGAGASTGGASMGSGGTFGGGGSSTGGALGGGGDPTGSTGGSDGTGGDGNGADEVPPGDACAAVADWPEEWSAREEEILALVNQERASGATCGGEARSPAGPLTMDPHLRCAARLHSMDMAERDYFSHATWDESANTCSGNGECSAGYSCQPRSQGTSPSRCGKSPSLRVQEIGGPNGAGWENIAAGNSSAADTMGEQWMTSAGHCNNIMDADLQTIGVGYYGGGSYGHYWTQSFND